MEAYGVALYEMPQTLLLNYSYDLPFGRGRRFLSSSDSWGQRILGHVVGGWALAGVSTWNPKGTPVLVPQMNTGTTAAGAAHRWSLDPKTNYLRSGIDYSKALVVNGEFVNPSPQGIFNRTGFVETPDFSLSNAPFVFPNVRNPGSFFTDATLLKKFFFSENQGRYLEARVEALNVLNHPNFGTIDPNNAVDNNPDSPTFGGIHGKYGSRTMQIGLRLFF
jgi:hypothetical protein